MTTPSPAAPPRAKGLPIVISAPSGAGKSTIAARIAQLNPNAVPSISCTTRPARNGEVNGQDYFFLSQEEFKRKIDANEFLEWATVHGQYYGTPVESLEKPLEEGKDVLLTIDPQGAISVKRIYSNAVFIFVVPPTWDALMKRLYKRATDGPEAMRVRLDNARRELSYLPHYDYLVVNDDLEAAVADVAAIIAAEHRRLARIDIRRIPIFEKEG